MNGSTSAPAQRPESAADLRDAIITYKNWPAMAKLVARCIDSVAGHEQIRHYQLGKIAALEARIAALERSAA